MNTATNLATKLDLLRHMALFAALSEEEREHLAPHCHILRMQKGDALFLEGDKAGGMHMVLGGLIKMFRATIDGREIVLHLIRPGNSVGEGSVFKGGVTGKSHVYPASAMAAEESEVLFIPSAELLRLIRTNGEFALSMLSSLATRLYMFTRKLEAHSMREAPQRLAAYLLHRHRMCGGGDSIRLDVSREMLAALLGTARETVSRTLSRLVEAGAITVKGREVRLLDKHLLQSMAEGQEK